MKARSIDSQITQLYSLMNQDEMVLVYTGSFSQETVKSMLKYTENKLGSSGVNDLTRKKIFNVMTEMLQNITKHQHTGDETAVFILGEKNNSFYLVTGNHIPEDVIGIIDSKIQKINSLSKDELKEFHKAMRLNSTISSAGGAGLGFIDIVRKSENPLNYQFEEDDNKHFFILKATIENNHN